MIAIKSNATILGISETKLDKTIMDNELFIEDYDLIRSYWNRYGGGVTSYLKKESHYNAMEGVVVIQLTLTTFS